MSNQDPFWKVKKLDQFSKNEWESLCDGCALCCLQKLEDEDTEEVFYTSVVCRYLDKENASCTCYNERTQLVPNCLKLEYQHLESFSWLPESCSYRLVYEGKDLPEWHHLKTGIKKSVIQSGRSVLNVYTQTDQNISEDDLINAVMEEGLIFRG